MFDCANVEMRELLPALAAGVLDAAARARVEAHVLGCAECASELETLRHVRAAFAAVPPIDTRRITAALPKPPAAVGSSTRRAPAERHWMDWRVAAALTMITLGGLSVAVTERLQSTRRAGEADTDASVVVPPVVPPAGITQVVPAPPPPSVSRGDAGGGPRANDARPSVARPGKPQLVFGGGSADDLDDASLRALLGALDEIDRGPVAPSVDPDRTPVLPVIEEGDR
jgi:anti-sigma factor RsiW